MEIQKCICVTDLARRWCRSSIGKEDCVHTLYQKALTLEEGEYHRRHSGSGEYLKLVVRKGKEGQSMFRVITVFVQIDTTITVSNKNEAVAFFFLDRMIPVLKEQFDNYAAASFEILKTLI